MKKIYSKIVVTDNNGKDNTLILFIPIAQGEDKKECKDFLDTVSVFVNEQLKKEDNELRDRVFSYGMSFTHNVPLTNKEATHLATTLLDTIEKKIVNPVLRSYQLEDAKKEIETSININDDYRLCLVSDGLIELLTLDIVDNNKIKLVPMLFPSEFIKHNLNNLNISDILHVSNRELFPDSNDEYPLFINKNNIEFLKTFNGLDISKITFHRVSIDTEEELGDAPKKKVIKNSKKESFQKISPFPVTLEESFLSNKTSFIIALSSSGEYSHMHLNGEYSLCLSGLPFVSRQINKRAVFYKVESIDEKTSAYLDVNKNMFDSADVYISEQSIIKIMERFDLSYSEFNKKVLTYGGYYYLEEILDKENLKPNLNNHQLEDTKEVIVDDYLKDTENIISTGDNKKNEEKEGNKK